MKIASTKHYGILNLYAIGVWAGFEVQRAVDSVAEAGPDDCVRGEFGETLFASGMCAADASQENR